MPMVMEKSEWLKSVVGSKRFDRAWFETVKPRSNRISLGVPREFKSYSFQVVMIPVAESSTDERGKPVINELKNKIRSLPNEYVEDWDGYGAKAVSRISMSKASRFADLIPTTARSAEVCVDPEGEVYFEWRPSVTKYCSVTFAEDGSYLCLVKNGKNKILSTTNVRAKALEYVLEVLD